MQAAPERAFPVTILTHEGGGPPPHEQTLSQLLTDLFTSAGVGVHTLVLAGDLAKSVDRRSGLNALLTLVDSELHKKECVPTTGYMKMKKQTTEVMFLQCHGITRREPCKAALCFRCEQNEVDTSRHKSTQALFACPTQEQAQNPWVVSLHSVVQGCKLAILLACAGDQVIEDYLKSVGSAEFPDMLVCNAPLMSSATTEILTAMLVNIVDSDLAHTRQAGDVYQTVRAAIVRIFQIVKLFGTDHDGFWGFLKQAGYVNYLSELKQRQQLGYPRRYTWEGDDPRYRIYVSNNTYREKNMINQTLYELPQHVFEQFRALQLVCKRHEPELEQPLKRQKSERVDDFAYRIDCSTVSPIVLGIADKYLQDYVPPPAPADSFMAAPPVVDNEAHMRISALLARMKCV